MPGLSLAPAILSAPVAGLAALVVLIGGTSEVAAESRFPGLTGGSVCSMADGADQEGRQQDLPSQV